MSNYQEESIEDRLAKRRRLRNKRYLKNNTSDESEITVINHSPTTQSLDRKSSKRITTKSSGQHKSSTELPLIEKSHSIPLQPQVTQKQYERTQNSLAQIEKPIVPSSVITEKSKQNFQPIVNKETILPPTVFEKFDPIYRGYSTPNQIKNFEEHPQSTPLFPSKPITRTISEQVVSVTTKYKHQPVGSMFAKQNSLALPYLFNKRLIDAELARTSSLDSKQSPQKTVWD